MSMKNNTIKKRKLQYKHLTKEQRVKIETLINLKDKDGKRMYSNTEISKIIGVHKSTISRELKKRIKSKLVIRSGRIINKPYNAIDAQNDYKYKRAMSKAQYKLESHPQMAKFIVDKIKKDKWSPDAIVGYMKNHDYFNKEGYCSITTPTIYNAIRHSIIDIKLEDTRRMKYNPKYEYHAEFELIDSKKEYSIDKRPKEIDKRLVFGHFELDTVLGKKEGIHECLMTLTERKTRFEMVFKLKAKTSQEVVNKFNKLKSFLKRYYNRLFKSITTDNGSEFSKFLGIIKDTRTQIYFCHPYCSGEKGTNERHNGIIRYFIPKGDLIENYSCEQINNIVNWMNNYPRKILNYKTPLEAILEEFNDKNIINKIYKIQEKVNCL